VVVANGPGEGFRKFISGFEQAYPDIKLEVTALSGTAFVTRVLAERRADQYLWDLSVGGPAGHFLLKPYAEVLDPIVPAVIQPGVAADDLWTKGFRSGLIDSDQTYVFSNSAWDEGTRIWVNRDVIPESELKSSADLLDPKWKGKISIHDPRTTGIGQATASTMVAAKSEDWLRQLLSQDIGVTADYRQQIDWLVRGQYPIAVGAYTVVLYEYQNQGVGKNIQLLAADPDIKGWYSQGTSIALINRPPNPNAAKVFLNWFLSKDGQTHWVKNLPYNSSRRDVEVADPLTKMDPAAEYKASINWEKFKPFDEKAKQIAEEILQ
jgi:iron(III) transport system substrate-binding protein